MNQIISNIRKLLIENSDTKTQESGKRFFKEEVKLYGVKTAVLDKIGKQYLADIRDLNKTEVFKLAEELWMSGFMEETFIACNMAYSMKNSFQPDDFKILEKWVNNYVSNWASCDTLCNHTIGTFIEMYPDYLNNLKVWAKSSNRWMRRAAAVTLIIPARHGKFLNEIFDIADILLMDGDNMVQKGYGWLLKAASQSHQKQVFDYVKKNKNIMPRTALRYAIEKMPIELRELAMRK
jgi:3-methyladenine DNA glycosylase AlkD